MTSGTGVRWKVTVAAFSSARTTGPRRANAAPGEGCVRHEAVVFRYFPSGSATTQTYDCKAVSTLSLDYI